MSNVRIDRMTKELQAEPSLQFFQWILDVALSARANRGAARAPVSMMHLEKAA